MIGIYCFINKINNKKYIGQSINIEERKESHLRYYNNPNMKDYNTKFYRALRKYGTDQFTFQILEECSKSLLDEREIFWIEKFDSFKNGYNSTLGGQIGNTKGELHPNAKLTNQEVLLIKEKLLNSAIKKSEIAKYFKVTQSEISNINTGKKWRDIGNFNYPIRKLNSFNKKGSNSNRAIFTDEEILEIRKQYQFNSGKEIYVKYQDRCSYTTFERILIGKSYKNIPIYKKSLKQWITID